MNNPFRPTFGASPRVWAGRDIVLSDFERAINGTPGNPDRSLLISGSRGISKTVLLTELEDIASQQGWIVLRASAREDVDKVLVESSIPEALELLEQPSSRKITGLSIAGIGSISTELTNKEPSQRLTTRLRELIARLHETGVVITIDEIQDVSTNDLTQIAIAYQDLVRDDLPVAVIMAGLTQGINTLLNLPGATFLRRARHYELGPLTIADAQLALEGTAREGGVAFPAAAQAAAFSYGYPYLVQLVGYLAWESAAEMGRAQIDDRALAAAMPVALERLGTQVHQPALREVPHRQFEYLATMAMLEQHTPDRVISTADIAAELAVPTTSLSDTRSKLIDRDLIIPAGWGKVEFAQPYLGEYIRDQRRPQRVQ